MMRLRSALLFLIMLTMAGAVQAITAYGTDIAIGDHIAPAVSSTHISHVYPVDGNVTSHNSPVAFTALALSDIYTISNTTLTVWDGLSVLYLTAFDSTSGDGYKYFGPYSFPTDTYSWELEACDENSCFSTSSMRTFITTSDSPTVVLNSPPDEQYDEDGDLALTCTVSGTSDFLNFTKAEVWDVDGSRVRAPTITSDGDGAREFGVYGLSNGNYSWGCTVCDLDMDCDTTANWTFIVNAIAPESDDGEGECLTDRGYSFEYTAAAGDDYVLLDLTGLGEYLADVDARNVWIEHADGFKYADNKILVNTTDPENKQFIVWIGGHNYDKAHATDTTAPDTTLSMELGNFTQENPAYWIEIRNETDGSFWDYADSTTHVLDSYCQNYAPERVDIKNDITTTRFLITSKQNPLFHGILDGSFNRKIRTESSSGIIKLFFLAGATTYNIDFDLEDYINQFSRSYLQVYRKVNLTLDKIWQDQWYHLQVLDVTMENDSYYQYVVYTPTDTRVIAWDLIDSGDPVTISIYEHELSDRLSYLEGIQLGFTSSYAGSSVGVEWNTTIANDIKNISFNVYSHNGTQYESIFSHNIISPADLGSYIYIVPDANATYYLTARCFLASENNYVAISDKKKPRETEADPPYYDSIGLPNSFWGVSKDNLYTGISMLLIFAISSMWGRINTANGGLMTAFIIGIVYKFRWFREMTLEIVIVIFVVAVIYKLTEGRRMDEQ